MTAVMDSPPIGFEGIPIMEQHSHLLGVIRLYAPATSPAEWREHPWQLTTENGYGGKDSAGFVYRVKPQHAVEAFRHIALVQYNPAWHA